MCAGSKVLADAHAPGRVALQEVLGASSRSPSSSTTWKASSQQCGLLSLNNKLHWGRVVCCFGLLGRPGTAAPLQRSNHPKTRARPLGVWAAAHSADGLQLSSKPNTLFLVVSGSKTHKFLCTILKEPTQKRVLGLLGALSNWHHQ